MESMSCWLNDLLGAMEESAAPAACRELLRSCGAGCAARNTLPGVKEWKQEIARAESLEELVTVIRRVSGAECEPDGNGFRLTYNRGKGCDCALVREAGVTSPAFCDCTLGFHRALWSAALNRPVQVELLETFLRGGSCCAQRITILPGEEQTDR